MSINGLYIASVIKTRPVSRFVANTAIILAGGDGLRVGGNIPKQFMTIDGAPLLQFSVTTFLEHESIDKVIIVSRPDDCKQVAIDYPSCTVIEGGETRRESATRGVEAAQGSTVVLLHDAARPFVSSGTITTCLEALGSHDAAAPVLGMADSVIQMKQGRPSFINREALRSTQTPQVFKYPVIKKAQEHITRNHMGKGVTDEIGLVLKHINATIALVPGDSFNFKVTTKADFVFAEQLIRNRNQVNDIVFDASGKRALVLGGTSGIGSAIARRLEALGASVTTAGSEIEIEKADALEQFYNQEWDIIVHSAGVMAVGGDSIIVPLEDMTYDMWDHSLRINLYSAFLTAQLALETMKGGHVVFIGSSSARRGRSTFTAYSAAKAGLLNFAQGFAEEAQEKGIKVNLINPSRTDTKMRKVFSGEDKTKMLSPERVADIAVSYCHGPLTGQVFDIRVGE